MSQRTEFVWVICFSVLVLLLLAGQSMVDVSAQEPPGNTGTPEISTKVLPTETSGPLPTVSITATNPITGIITVVTTPSPIGTIIPLPTGGIVTATIPLDGYPLGQGYIRLKPINSYCGGTELLYYLDREDSSNPDLFSGNIDLGFYVNQYVLVKGLGVHNVADNCDYWEVHAISFLPTAIELSKFNVPSKDSTVTPVLVLLLTTIVVVFVSLVKSTK